MRNNLEKLKMNGEANWPIKRKGRNTCQNKLKKTHRELIVMRNRGFKNDYGRKFKNPKETWKKNFQVASTINDAVIAAS